MGLPAKEHRPCGSLNTSPPQSLSEALAVFQEHGEGGRALAGGTTVVGTDP